MVNNTDTDIKIHDLKIWPEFFDDVDTGRKSFELRRNDRNYQVGEILKLREWAPQNKEYSGRVTYKQINHIMRFADLGSDILTTLGLNPRPSSMSTLAILSIAHMTTEASIKMTFMEMKARPLNITEMGDPDFESNHYLAAQIHKIDVYITTPDQDALLDTYLITSNEFHPGWIQWICTLVHLREINGSRPAIKDYPQAEYEMTVQAIDPGTPISSRETDFHDIRFLNPIDSKVQFNGIDDYQAKNIQTMMMQLIANGQISPDSDFRRIWTQEVNRRVLEMRSAH